MQVNDIMERRVPVLNEEDALAGVGRAMERFGLRRVPVVDGTRLVGVLDEREVFRRMAAPEDPAGVQIARARSGERFAGGLVERDAPRLRESDDVDAAFEAFARTGHPSLPVVNAAGNLVGVVRTGGLGRVTSTLLATDCAPTALRLVA